MTRSVKNYFAFFCVITILLILNGCKQNLNATGTLYVPTSANVTANATLAELQQGRTLYMNNCGSCHQLYMPESYSPVQWKSVLNSMAPRTGMSASQILLVTKYVSMGKQ